MVAGAARRQGPHLLRGKGDIRGSLTPLTACFMRPAAQARASRRQSASGRTLAALTSSLSMDPDQFDVFAIVLAVCEQLDGLCMDVSAEHGSRLASAIIEALREAELRASPL